VIDFNAEDPVEAIRRLTGGIGVDRAIDAVGDAYRAFDLRDPGWIKVELTPDGNSASTLPAAVEAEVEGSAR